MDLASALFAPGLIGGVVVAVWLVIAHRRARRSGQAALHRDDAVLVDPINMSRISVAGVGGLGLVAMAIVVAVFVPAIRLSLAIASVAGVLLAAGLILWRRRTGPLPSSGQRPGAATVLALESPDTTDDAAASEPARGDTRTTPRLRMA